MSCVFCKESEDPSYANSFLGPHWPFIGRIIAEANTAFAVPGYGPQVFPYALVITRRHITSLAQTTAQERSDIFDCLYIIHNMLNPKPQQLLVFEHAGCNNIQSCVEHFHLHVVDARYDVTWALQSLNPIPIHISISTSINHKEPYLLAAKVEKDRTLNGYIALVKTKEDQFFRRALAEMIGDSEWDWRLGMNEQFMLDLMDRSPYANRNKTTTSRLQHQASTFQRRSLQGPEMEANPSDDKQCQKPQK